MAGIEDEPSGGPKEKLTRMGAGAVDNLISGVTTSWFATTIWGMLLSIALLIFEVEIPSMRMKTEQGTEILGRDL